VDAYFAATDPPPLMPVPSQNMLKVFFMATYFWCRWHHIEINNDFIAFGIMCVMLEMPPEQPDKDGWRRINLLDLFRLISVPFVTFGRWWRRG
jgi:hypothetical protein